MKARPYSLLAISILLPVTVASAASSEQGRMKTTALACLKNAYVDQLERVKDDKAALQKLIVMLMAGGECQAVEQGTLVKIDGGSLYHGTFCIRPQGEISCLWTLVQSVEIVH